MKKKIIKGLEGAMTVTGLKFSALTLPGPFHEIVPPRSWTVHAWRSTSSRCECDNFDHALATREQIEGSRVWSDKLTGRRHTSHNEPTPLWWAFMPPANPNALAHRPIIISMYAAEAHKFNDYQKRTTAKT